MPDPNSSPSLSAAASTTSGAQSGSRSKASSTSDTEQQSQHGSGIVNKVRETATAQLASQKNRATEGLGDVADFVRQSTEELRRQKHETIAGYVEQAADQIDKFSQSLREKDVAELMTDVQRLARKQPAVFIGGAFALGLFGARFLKSSGQDERPAERSARYRGDRFGQSASPDWASPATTGSTTTAGGTDSGAGVSGGSGAATSSSRTRRTDSQKARS